MITCDNTEDLEKLFLPSRWSKRLPPDIIVDKHVEFCYQESDRTKQTIPHNLDLPYGPLNKEKLDIFGTDLSNDAPVFVFVHGGYWQEESLRRDTYHFIASNLYENGIKSIFVGYELCPNIPLREIIKEIETATLKCIESARKNGSKSLHLAGHSAGSQLIASLFTNLVQKLTSDDRDAVKSAILIGGIYDLRQIPNTSVNEPLKLTEQEASELSPLIQNIAKNQTLFCIVAAANDSPEFQQQSRRFHEKLQNSGVKSQLEIVQNVDHFDIIEKLKDKNFEVTRMIINLCKR